MIKSYYIYISRPKKMSFNKTTLQNSVLEIIESQNICFKYGGATYIAE